MGRGVDVLGETRHEQQSDGGAIEDEEKQPGILGAFWCISEDGVGELKKRLVAFYTHRLNWKSQIQVVIMKIQRLNIPHGGPA